jgi:hypothetical protein
MKKPINPMKLNLCAPLFYKKEQLDPYSSTIDNVERLFCFEIDPKEAQSIEPDAAVYLGSLIASGRLAASGQPAGSGDEESLEESDGLELPAGKYFFAQLPEFLERGDCIQMAIEVQKDGLWERLALENRLYIRRLFEDGRRVTQVFRGIK